MQKSRLNEFLEVLPVSSPYECHYLPTRIAAQQHFVWPKEQGIFNSHIYQALMDSSFRRSGRMFYRPQCQSCQKCIPIRIAISEFSLTPSHKKNLKKNSDITIIWQKPRCGQMQFKLYQKYLRVRHAETFNRDKDLSEQEQYQDFVDFLYDSPIETLESQYFLNDQLIGVGICDVTNIALSSVYFYFDPDFSKRSLGLFSSLKEIEYAAKNNLQYYYLGYYVEGCQKMEYKKDLSAKSEYLINEEWKNVPI